MLTTHKMLPSDSTESTGDRESCDPEALGVSGRRCARLMLATHLTPGTRAAQHPKQRRYAAFLATSRSRQPFSGFPTLGSLLGPHDSGNAKTLQSTNTVTGNMMVVVPRFLPALNTSLHLIRTQRCKNTSQSGRTSTPATSLAIAYLEVSR